MPTRQETFRLVPTTLVNTTTLRRAMTSKAAKKAYRESTRLPKVSRAEQRRREAEEIAQQKKEYERERAAEKAKAAREKKLAKEKEQRSQRKKMGLPEASRFVRASQPTIKLFVKTETGSKRSWEEMNEHVLKDADVEGNEKEIGEPTPLIQPLPRTDFDENIDDYEEFGDFPALSQLDLPDICETKDNPQKRGDNVRASQALGSSHYQSSPHPIYHLSPVPSPQHSQLQLLAAPGSLRKRYGGMTKGKALEEVNDTPRSTSPVSRNLRSTVPKAIPVHSNGMANPSPKASESSSDLTYLATKNPRNLDTSKTHGTKTMPLPPVPTNTKASSPGQMPKTVTGGMAPPAILSEAGISVPTTRTMLQSNKTTQHTFTAPPSTALAFLAANMDGFFPSPSQQVRELLEGVDDVPSNTQIAREISTEPKSNLPQVTVVQSQPEIKDLGCDDFSSQDFEISSQDLRDIDTPSKSPSKAPPRLPASARIAGLTISFQPPQAPRIKPRFFEEKEDDLLYAALHESSLMAKKQQQKSNPAWSRALMPVTHGQSFVSDSGEDDYGFRCSQVDPEFLALLDAAEERPVSVFC